MSTKEKDEVVLIPLSQRTPELEEQVLRYMQIIKPLPENTIKYERVKEPSFTSEENRVKWQREQLKRCIHGHNGMSGKMYFWFNFCYIKNLKGGRIVPEFRNCDNHWFNELYDSKANQEGIICVKRRRAGFSWKAAADALHDSIFNKFSVIGLNSKGERDSIHLFQKIMFIYENLPTFMKASIGAKRGMKVEFYSADKDENKNIKKSGVQSEINVVPPTDSAYEGLMLSKWICDEAGKIPNLPQMWSYTEDCLMQETVRYGQPILFGTSGDVSKDGAGLMGMWEHSDVYRLRRFFFGGWMGIHVDELGNDLIEDSVRWIVYERKRRESLPGKQYSDFLQRYPLTVAEAFSQYTESGIGDVKKINRQITSLIDNPVKERRGYFTIDNDGKVSFQVSAQGKVIMYEEPSVSEVYLAGCLPAGEKVLTDSGLKSIEEVNFNDKLISKDGEYVGIKELQRYKVDEPLYELSVRNTFRKTKFTGEHPIYVSENKKGYTSSSKRKREGLKYSHQKFDFNFKPIKEIKKEEWIKFPNVYKRVLQKEPHILDDLNISWFIGLWLGDGWIEKGNVIHISINNSELEYLERIKEITKSKIGIKECEGCIDISFRDNSILEILGDFGKYAYGKTIPEWFKFMNHNTKLALFSGYMDSDGCVTEDKRRGFYSGEIVSINLEMIEHLQDILFSIGVISSSSLLRLSKKTEIRGRTVDQKEAYRLRLGHYWMRRLKEMGSNSFKISEKNYSQSRNNNMGCFFSDNLDYIYFQIKNIEVSHIKGIVYNFHCDTSTFLCKNITTHNCDPADHDDALNGASDLSLHILKKQSGQIGPKVVLEYVDRPANLIDYYNQAYYALLYYNRCKCLVEKNRFRMISHFTMNNWQNVLATPPQGLNRLFPVRSNVIGIHMNPDVKNYMKGIISDYIDEYCDLIPSVKLLQEFMDFGSTNTDRVFSFGLALMLLREDKRKSSTGIKKTPSYSYQRINGKIVRTLK